VKNHNLTNHHILSERCAWEARPESKRLRRHGGLIVRMAQEPHTALHEACTAVPIPNVYMLRGIARAYVMGREPLESLDNFCFAVEEAAQHPKAIDIDKRLGDIMIDSIRMQIPFIKEHGVGI
jgi:hypothetical protein